MPFQIENCTIESLFSKQKFAAREEIKEINQEYNKALAIKQKWLAWLTGWIIKSVKIKVDAKSNYKCHTI